MTNKTLPSNTHNTFPTHCRTFPTLRHQAAQWPAVSGRRLSIVVPQRRLLAIATAMPLVERSGTAVPRITQTQNMLPNKTKRYPNCVLSANARVWLCCTGPICCGQFVQCRDSLGTQIYLRLKLDTRGINRTIHITYRHV